MTTSRSATAQDVLHVTKTWDPLKFKETHWNPFKFSHYPDPRPTCSRASQRWWGTRLLSARPAALFWLCGAGGTIPPALAHSLANPPYPFSFLQDFRAAIT